MTIEAADRSWTHTLDPERRRRLRELYRIRPGAGAAALGFVALWGVGGWLALATPHLALRLFAYGLSGIAIHALATLMHEASHGNLFRRRVLDRWAAFLLGAPALLSGAAYRVVHLEHHRHLRTARDPEEMLVPSLPRWAQSLVFYAWMVAGTWTYVAYVPMVGLARGSRRERRRIALEYALLALLYGTLLGLARAAEWRHVLLQVLVFPWVVAVVLSNVRGWAEHGLTRPGHPLTQTRTVTANRLVSLLMCNTNYHLEHHLFPAVPWYRLPRLHHLLAAEYRSAGSAVQRSYVRFVWDAARAGVHGTVPGRG